MLPPDGLLQCPACGAALAHRDHALRCAAGHSYDIARQGYVNLLLGHLGPGTADTREMVAARDAFLSAGHYAPIEAAVAEALAAAPAVRGGLIVDVGAGTGHYLRAVLERLPATSGLALDISKDAIRRAVRSHPRIAGAVCDAWGRLPLADGGATAVLSVFAPRNPAEFARILAPGGCVVTVTPREEHLRELVGPLDLVRVEAEKEERLARTFGPHFDRAGTQAVRADLRLGHDEARQLVEMGPSARHGTRAGREAAIAALPERLTATVSVTVSVWIKRG